MSYAIPRSLIRAPASHKSDNQQGGDYAFNTAPVEPDVTILA